MRCLLLLYAIFTFSCNIYFCHAIFTFVMRYLLSSCNIYFCHAMFAVVMQYLLLSCDIYFCHAIFTFVMQYLLLSCDVCCCHAIFTFVMRYLLLSCNIYFCHAIFTFVMRYLLVLRLSNTCMSSSCRGISWPCRPSWGEAGLGHTADHRSFGRWCRMRRRDSCGRIGSHRLVAPGSFGCIPTQSYDTPEVYSPPVPSKSLHWASQTPDLRSVAQSKPIQTWSSPM